MTPIKDTDVISWDDPIFGAGGKLVGNHHTSMTARELLDSELCHLVREEFKEKLGRDPSDQEVLDELAAVNWAEVDKA